MMKRLRAYPMAPTLTERYKAIHFKASELSGIDGWIRMRLRSILRKRRGLDGRGRGIDHQR
jgi:hypothetical protein